MNNVHFYEIYQEIHREMFRKNHIHRKDLNQDQLNLHLNELVFHKVQERVQQTKK